MDGGRKILPDDINEHSAVGQLDLMAAVIRTIPCVCVGEVAASDTRNAFSHLREQENSRLREKLCHHPELHHDICTLVRDLNLEVRSWVRADVVRVVRADTFHLTELA